MVHETRIRPYGVFTFPFAQERPPPGCGAMRNVLISSLCGFNPQNTSVKEIPHCTICIMVEGYHSTASVVLPQIAAAILPEGIPALPHGRRTSLPHRARKGRYLREAFCTHPPDNRYLPGQKAHMAFPEILFLYCNCYHESNLPDLQPFSFCHFQTAYCNTGAKQTRSENLHL